MYKIYYFVLGAFLMSVVDVQNIINTLFEWPSTCSVYTILYKLLLSILFQILQ